MKFFNYNNFIKLQIMKKLLIVLLVLGVSTQVFGKLKEKQVIGKWKYTVETDQGQIEGVFNIIKEEGKLGGEVVTDDGYTLPFTKVEIKEDDTLYMELTTDSDVITISVKIEGDAFNGTASSYMGEAPIVGEKQEVKK